MSYPEAVNLPFNGKVLDGQFRQFRGEISGNPAGYWAILRGPSLLVVTDTDKYSLYEGERPEWLPARVEPTVIGELRGMPLLAVAVAKELEPGVGWSAEPFNAVHDRLDDLTLTIGGIANQILHWERNSMLCPRCGGATTAISGSWGKRCGGCGSEHFPHIHPCVIVLVRRGTEFLLARKPEWATGRYGLIAGFLDFGESLEECVAREVMEETGLRVKNVKYVGSQSWPFPSQMMTGFVADYAGGDILVDKAELEDARWFCAEDLPAGLPPRRSIARWIIDRYALGK